MGCCLLDAPDAPDAPDAQDGIASHVHWDWGLGLHLRQQLDVRVEVRGYLAFVTQALRCSDAPMPPAALLPTGGAAEVRLIVRLRCRAVLLLDPCATQVPGPTLSV